MTPLVVMISSTARDLPLHREEVKRACIEASFFPQMMETCPAADADAIAASLRMVDEADVYIGVFACRYGYVPRGHDKSLTEMEYDRACERKIPRLLFLMHEAHEIRIHDVESGPGADKLASLKGRIASERVVAFFKTPEDLRANVLHALNEFRNTRFPRSSVVRIEADGRRTRRGGRDTHLTRDDRTSGAHQRAVRERKYGSAVISRTHAAAPPVRRGETQAADFRERDLASRALDHLAADNSPRSLNRCLLRSDVEPRRRLRAAVRLLHQEHLTDRIEYVLAQIIDVVDEENGNLGDWCACAALVGSILRELRKLGDHAPNPHNISILQRNIGRVFDSSSTVPIDAAIRAADGLGLIGDPRFDERHRDRNWVLISAGEYVAAGRRDAIVISQYHIGAYPVTVGEYVQFVAADGYRREELWQAGGFQRFSRPGYWTQQLLFPTRPVVNVSWYECAAYASFVGARLPTEVEWERAARGVNANSYPWGNDRPTTTHLNFRDSYLAKPTPVGIYVRGATPSGVFDMAGNVAQWCADQTIVEDRVRSAAPRSLLTKCIVRGSDYADDEDFAVTSRRVLHNADFRSRAIGIRLVQ